MLRITLAIFAVVTLALSLLAPRARAERPFIVDSADSLLAKKAQLETYIVANDEFIDHALYFNMGLTDWLEFSFGARHGIQIAALQETYRLNAPLLELKGNIIRARGWRPGLALVSGVRPPWGVGEARPRGFGGYIYAAVTERVYFSTFGLHINLGLNMQGEGEGFPSGRRFADWLTAGVALDIRAHERVAIIAEYAYRDPYDPRANRRMSVQGGLRIFLNDWTELDFGLGGAFDRESEALDVRSGKAIFGTAGFRFRDTYRW